MIKVFRDAFYCSVHDQDRDVPHIQWIHEIPMSSVNDAAANAAVTDSTTDSLTLAHVALRGSRQPADGASAPTAGQADAPSIHPTRQTKILVVGHDMDLRPFRSSHCHLLEGLAFKKEMEDAGKLYFTALVPETAAAPFLKFANDFAARRFKRVGCATEVVGCMPAITLAIHRPPMPPKAARAGATPLPRPDRGRLPTAWPAAFLLKTEEYVAAALLRPSQGEGVSCELLVGVSSRNLAIQVRELAQELGLTVRCDPSPTHVVRLEALNPVGFDAAADVVHRAIVGVAGPVHTFRPKALAEWRLAKGLAARVQAALEAPAVQEAVATQRLLL